MSLTSLGSVAGEEVCLDLATELPGNCSAEDPTCMTDERLQSVSCILHWGWGRMDCGTHRKAP
jgi:hypothetical protein